MDVLANAFSTMRKYGTNIINVTPFMDVKAYVKSDPRMPGTRLLPTTTLSAIGAGMEHRGEISVLPIENDAQKARVCLTEQYQSTKEKKQ